MGRRRRRVIRIVKKKLPTVFVCPRCGEEAVRVSIDKTTGKATVACAICQLKDEFDAHPQAQAIDVYSYFTDRFYGVKDPRAIIPRERTFKGEIHAEPEGEEEEAEADVETPERLAPDETTAPGVEPSLTEQNAQEEEKPALNADEAGTDSEVSSPTEEEKTSEEEENPFGDIMSSEKEKKRYSPNPIAQESSSSE